MSGESDLQLWYKIDLPSGYFVILPHGQLQYRGDVLGLTSDQRLAINGNKKDITVIAI